MAGRAIRPADEAPRANGVVRRYAVPQDEREKKQAARAACGDARMDQHGASELTEWKARERRSRDGSEPRDLRERKFPVMIWLKDSVAARESLARRVPADSK